MEKSKKITLASPWTLFIGMDGCSNFMFLSWLPGKYRFLCKESVHEDGDLSFGLRGGGSVNCFACPALDSDVIDLKNGGLGEERHHCPERDMQNNSQTPPWARSSNHRLHIPMLCRRGTPLQFSCTLGTTISWNPCIWARCLSFLCPDWDTGGEAGYRKPKIWGIKNGNGIGLTHCEFEELLLWVRTLMYCKFGLASPPPRLRYYMLRFLSKESQHTVSQTRGEPQSNFAVH